MPNFKLGSGVTNEINVRCKELTERRVEYARDGFPLTQDELQAATMPNDLLADLCSLADRGVRGLPQEQYPYIRLERSSASSETRDKLYGLQREAVIRVVMPGSIYVKQSTHFYGSSIEPNKNHHLLAINPEAIGPDAVARLVAWTNNLVRVSRHKKLVDNTVFAVLAACPSIGHVLAAWPLLATLVTDSQWKQRFRNGPRSLVNYAPNIELLRRMDKRMQASEAVLAEAEMLEPFKRTAGQIRGQLDAWETLPGDVF